MSDASSSLASLWNPVAFPFFPLAKYPNQDEGTAPVIHKCNLCGAEYNDETDYKQHLKTHFDHCCPFCDYVSKTEGRLKRHVKELHDPPSTAADSTMTEQTSESDENPRGTPNRSKSGRDKQRASKCKQCGFSAATREEFWEHSKTHMKGNKIFTCHTCPFITEYKHHLEYHIRNHYGSKPFKCHKCNYSCVNKSMLNSHLKSHSNVYQYRCEDCNYATKYCHSLKLHLRKYNHRPAIVLNPDGTPNPYPIIDVYGTRRGPRPKKSASQQPPQVQQPPQMTAVPPSTEQPATLADLVATDEISLSLGRPGWFESLTMTNLPVLSWSLHPELRQAILAHAAAARSREQQSQVEAETDVLNIGGRVEDLAIKEEAVDWSDEAPLDLSRSSPHSPGSSSGTPASPFTEPSSSGIGKDPHEQTTSSGIYSCRFCELDFRDSSMYKNHMKYHDVEKPFKCKVCGEETSDRVAFQDHLNRKPHW